MVPPVSGEQCDPKQTGQASAYHGVTPPPPRAVKPAATGEGGRRQAEDEEGEEKVTFPRPPASYQPDVSLCGYLETASSAPVDRSARGGRGRQLACSTSNSSPPQSCHILYGGEIYFC